MSVKNVLLLYPNFTQVKSTGLNMYSSTKLDKLALGYLFNTVVKCPTVTSAFFCEHFTF